MQRKAIAGVRARKEAFVIIVIIHHMPCARTTICGLQPLLRFCTAALTINARVRAAENAYVYTFNNETFLTRSPDVVAMLLQPYSRRVINFSRARPSSRPKERRRGKSRGQLGSFCKQAMLKVLAE